MIAGGRSVFIAPDMRAMSWSPDGRLFTAVVAERGQPDRVVLVSRDGTMRTLYQASPPKRAGAAVMLREHPRWLSDSSAVIVVVSQDSPGGTYRTPEPGSSEARVVDTVLRLNVATGAADALYEADHAADGPLFLLGARRRHVALLQGGRPALLDMQTRQVRLLAAQPGFAPGYSWRGDLLSPDERYLAVRGVNGDGGSGVYDLASGTLHRIADNRADPHGWSNDSARVLWRNQSSYFVTSASGDDARTIFEGSGGAYPGFTTDGGVLYNKDGAGVFRTRPGGDQRLGEGSAVGVLDGSRVAIRRPNGDVVVLAADGATSSTLVRSAGHTFMAPTGDAAVVRRP